MSDHDRYPTNTEKRIQQTYLEFSHQTNTLNFKLNFIERA